MTVFCTSITNKAHQTDDYRLATNAIYSKLLGTDFTVESGETPEPTHNPDTKPDTKDTQSPETGDGMTVTVWVMAATLSVALCWCSPPRSVRIDLLPPHNLKTAPSALQAEGAAFSAGCRKWENVV